MTLYELINPRIVGTFKSEYKVEKPEEAAKECWENCGPWNEMLPQVGMSFLMTLKTQNKGYNPQVMKNPICHHYQIFSLDINDYERLTEDAMTTLPKLLSDVQSRPI